MLRYVLLYIFTYLLLNIFWQTFIRVCVYTYINICIYIRVCVCLCAGLCVCEREREGERVCVCLYIYHEPDLSTQFGADSKVRVYVCMHACMYVCMYVSMYMCVHMYAFIIVCTYMYVHVMPVADHLLVHSYVHMCIHVCTYIYVCTCHIIYVIGHLHYKHMVRFCYIQNLSFRIFFPFALLTHKFLNFLCQKYTSSISSATCVYFNAHTHKQRADWLRSLFL